MSILNDKSDSESDNPPVGLNWPWDDFVMLAQRLEANGSPHLAQRMGDIAHAIAQQQQQPEPQPILIRA